jgi:prepilin-type N-terminal cleavage/methylation domain-containing protein
MPTGCGGWYMSFKKESGFTIFELMMVISIIAILSALTIPNMIGWQNASKLRSAVNSLRGDLQMARSLAIKQNVVVKTQFAANNYVIAVVGGQVLKRQKLPAGVRIDLPDTTFNDDDLDGKPDTSFNGRGIPVPGVPGDLGTVVIEGRAGRRQLSINTVGRVQTS